MYQKQNIAKNICMIVAGSLIVACWILFIYNVTKDDPNDYSASIFAIFLTGPIMNIFLLSVGHLIEVVFQE